MTHTTSRILGKAERYGTAQNPYARSIDEGLGLAQVKSARARDDRAGPMTFDVWERPPGDHIHQAVDGPARTGDWRGDATVVDRVAFRARSITTTGRGAEPVVCHILLGEGRLPHAGHPAISCPSSMTTARTGVPCMPRFA